MSEKLITHLTEHIPYELLMLRHARCRLYQPDGQLNWNAFLEAFAVHARNLLDFLMNRKDSRNLKASEFKSAYRPPAHRDLDGIMEKLRVQILHWGKRRPSDPGEKLDVADADKLCQWIEDATARFLTSLSPEHRKHWDEDRARPPQTILLGTTPSGATNLPIAVSSATRP